METATLTEQNMDPSHLSPNPLKCPPVSQPLHLLSPERVNQQRIPQSPPMGAPLDENERPRTRDSFTSEVQSKVAFLNSLSGGNGSAQSSPTRTPRGHGNSNTALQRAVMGYEEAQASLATVTADLERVREELTARKKRERMLAQRVEELLGEIQAEREKRSRDQESYAKEVKRCRKEAYRAELAVVEVRQDLQEARSELKRSQAEAQHEKAEKEKSRQESFERAYALAGMVGEVDQLKDRLRAMERERDAALLEAKTNDVEVFVLPSQQDKAGTASQREKEQSQKRDHEQQSEEASVSLKRPMDAAGEPARVPGLKASRDMLKFAVDIYDKRSRGEKLTPEEEIRFLKQELRCARQKHAEDADMIHFMHMQCQFKACPCRLAEDKGERFVHDFAYDATLEDTQAPKKRKLSSEYEEMDSVQRSAGESPENITQATNVPSQDVAQFLPETTSVEAGRLPPDPTHEHLSRISEEPLLLEEAAEIPLPDPQSSELNSRGCTPELTAQLEDITQVIVEPGTASKPFSFSTSTTSNPAPKDMTPSLRHAESATAVLERDLFDLSPPKQAPPRRPSTAMGILTVDSPIRLVPDSPRSLRTLDLSPSHVYDYNHTITTTTKVALKGSPERHSLHKRSQSKPNLRSHSPGHSSAISHSSDHENESRAPSASPAPATMFPITPLHKQARSMQMQNLEQHAQSQPRPVTTSTTTRVPLKGLTDVAMVDDVFSPEKPGHGHAHTEVLNLNMDMNQLSNPLRISTASTGSNGGNDTWSNRASQAGTIPNSILGNVPGTPISREAALAQIRARRDRARSVNLKSASGKENRIAGGKVGGSPTKPKVVGSLFGRDKENVRREISQASAPGRFGY
ncbi:hypothetical protein PV08_00332 [Exophiala spinifera]|uniref:DNA endonuclease activator Ctp1 C-terminal domain-containing protein n=1 Tax=Exophiala spinifera TaxID=91928 RepID=A0A0D2BLD0_9EURO|nr:uncharacterized protein PV08_00332 [Exophiala spinifera]KIW19758.1 hypothetical protein PV08_00332 [Exophiala spinifera]